MHRQSKNKPMHILSINLWQTRQEYTVQKRKTLQQMVLGKLTATLKRKKLEHSFFHIIFKSKLKWIKDLNVRLETTKLLEENICSMVFDKDLSTIFQTCLLRQGKQKQYKQMEPNQTEKLLHSKRNHQ